MESRWITTRGTELHWREHGRGRPMVFLHGMADSHLSWLPLARAFPRRRLLLVDLPGHGLSGRPEAAYTPEWYGDVLGDWWDGLGLEDVDLVGHSFGGALAQLLLLSRGERVSTMTLIAPGGHGPEAGLALKLLTLPGADRVIQPFLGFGMRLFHSTMPSTPLSRAEAAHAGWLASKPGSARALVHTARAVIDLGGQTRMIAERAHELESLPPTAMLWGDADPILPVTQAHGASRWLDGLALRLYPGVGHFPQLERTRDVARDLEAHTSSRQRVRVAVDRIPRRRPSWIRRAWRWVGARFRRRRPAPAILLPRR